MEDQWNSFSNKLDKFINDVDFKLIRVPLESLQRLVNARSKGQAALPAEEVTATLDQLIKMHELIKFQNIKPHEAFRKVLSQSPQVDADTGQAAGKDYNFSRTQFLSQSVIRIKRELDTILVPVVLLVMTLDEAIQLSSDDIYKEYHNFENYFKQYKDLEGALLNENISGLLERYGMQRESWEPFSGSTITIAQLITEALDEVMNFNRPLQPEWIDIQVLTDEGLTEEQEKERRARLRLLRDEGCLVVMDLVSMMHPTIQKAYRRSLLDVYPNTLTIKVAPSLTALRKQLEQDMIAFIDKFSNMEFHKRYRLDHDNNCEEVFESLTFTRSLVGRVPSVIDKLLRKKASKNIQTDYKDSSGDD